MYSLQTFVYDIKKNTLPIFIFTKKNTFVKQSITFEYECVDNFTTLSKWEMYKKIYINIIEQK